MPAIESLSLIELAAALRSGSLPLEEYLSHLEENFRAWEPQVLAFVPEEGRFERLRRAAAELEQRFPEPLSRPSLYGVPIGVKDIFHVDGFVTRAGSQLPPKELQGPEADSVTTLRRAGALVFGKTVTTEFAYFGPGSTRNPHNDSHTPGGSSSGSAAGVGAGFCPLAFGTQTIGSITRPAAFCGVVGYKPSYERISRVGVIPLSPSLDHIGIFVSQMAGVALVTGLLCRDWNAQVSPSTTLTQPPLSPSAVRARTWRLDGGTNDAKPVLGVPEGPYLQRASTAGLAQFEQDTARLAEAGYEIRHVEVFTDFDEIYHRHNLTVAAEAARVHTDWYKQYHELYHPKTAELIERGKGIDDDTLSKALAGRGELSTALSAVMDAHGVDLWISPSAPGTAPAGLDSTGDPVMNLPWTHCGHPTLGIPSGRDEKGLPYGLQLAARSYKDEQLIVWGTQIETALVSAA